MVLLTKLTAQQEREFYAVKAIEHGWSRNILIMQIEARLFHREGKAITNFEKRLPSPQSDFAQAALKDPYLFDFLGLSKDAAERDVEHELVEHISRFLLELGAGFAFVGRQIRLSVGDDDFSKCRYAGPFLLRPIASGTKQTSARSTPAALSLPLASSAASMSSVAVFLGF